MAEGESDARIRNQPVQQVQVGTADRGSGDADDPVLGCSILGSGLLRTETR